MNPQTNTADVPAGESTSTEEPPAQSKHVLLSSLEDAAISKDGQSYNSKPFTIPFKTAHQVKTELTEQENETKTTSLSNKKIETKTALKTYALESFDRNVMIIFNHNKIDGYRERTGTEHDVSILKETFIKFNFHSIVHTDLTCDDLKAVLQQFSATDFSEYGCIVVAVLTHGVENGYLSAKDYVYHESELIAPLTSNRTLANKPKIFLIQACRGPMHSKAVTVGKYTKDIVQSDNVDKKNSLLHTLPGQADVLILHSTFAGNVSYRETNTGSWIIQSLCKNLEKYGDKEHLEDILRTVKYDVAMHKQLEVYNKKTGETELHKQMPVVMSTLRKKLYFTKS